MTQLGGPDVDFSHENFEEELEIDNEACDEETGDCLDFGAGVLPIGRTSGEY